MGSDLAARSRRAPTSLGSLLVGLMVLIGAGAARADVYLGVSGRGLVRFDGQHARSVVRKPSLVQNAAATRAGEIWFGDLFFARRLTSEGLAERRLVVPLYLRTSGGVPWFCNQKELTWFDGTWHSLAVPRSGPELVSDMEVDGRGRVTILVDGRLFQTQGETWAALPPPPVEQADFKHCRLAAAQDLYVACWRDVFRLGQDGWSTVARYENTTPSHFRVGGDRTLYVVDTGRVIVIPGDGSERFEVGLPSWQLFAFVVDERGRMWFGSDRGLAIRTAKGDPLKLPPALSTRAAVRALVVEGRGPDL